MRATARILQRENTPLDLVDTARSDFRVESYSHGSVIYRPGELADRVYLLRSGRVRLLKAEPDSITQHQPLLALLKSGDLFGELAPMRGTTYEEFAVAQGPVEVWSIESRDLRALVESRPALALEIIEGLYERQASLNQRVQALTFKEVPSRLAELLLILGETVGERGPHDEFVSIRHVTQQDMADLVGASRSFVSTLINEMKRDGLLSNSGRTLILSNPHGLLAVAQQERF